MGQAKRRGTFEERRTKAKAREQSEETKQPKMAPRVANYLLAASAAFDDMAQMFKDAERMKRGVAQGEQGGL